MTPNPSFAGLAEPDFERLIQFTQPLMAPPLTPWGDWDLSAFCILHPYIPTSHLHLCSPSLLHFSGSTYSIKLQSTNVDMFHQTIVESVAQPLLLPVTSISCASFWNLARRLRSIGCSAARWQSSVGAQGITRSVPHQTQGQQTCFPLLQGQLSEVDDLITGILGVLCHPCNFTASWVSTCDFQRSAMIHRGTGRIPAAHRQAEYKVPTKTAVGPLAKIYF